MFVLQVNLNLVSTGRTPVRALTTGVVGSPTAILPFVEPARAVSANLIMTLSAEPSRALSAELMGLNGAMLPAGGIQSYASATSAGLLMHRALRLALANSLKVREPFLQAQRSAGIAWLQYSH